RRPTTETELESRRCAPSTCARTPASPSCTPSRTSLPPTPPPRPPATPEPSESSSCVLPPQTAPLTKSRESRFQASRRARILYPLAPDGSGVVNRVRMPSTVHVQHLRGREARRR